MADLQQNEKAFMKQHAAKLAGPKLIAKKKGGRVRYFRNIGLGFKTPRAAIEGTYVDQKCPFTGNVSIRGSVLKGVVQSTKMTRTLVVRRDYLHFVRKYNRFEKRHTNISAHCTPAFNVKVGDIVTVGQCRPLSKTVRFNVIAHEPQAEGKAKVFRIF